MDNNIETNNGFQFIQVLDAIQPWLLESDYAELYSVIGATLDDLLGNNIANLKTLRNASTQNELMQRLLAEFLGFQWDGVSTLDINVISRISQTITNYYARNGCGAQFIHEPLGNNVLTQNSATVVLEQGEYSLPLLLESDFDSNAFYNSEVFINAQSTSRLISFATQSSIVIQQLWTKDYTSFYTKQELDGLFPSGFTYNDTIYSTLSNDNNFRYVGLWNAQTNTPTLVNGMGMEGEAYLVSVGGIVNFGDGDVAFNIGDYVQYNSGQWEKTNTGLWYMSPHVNLEVLGTNINVSYRNLKSLFSYLAPITMVLQAIKQRFDGYAKIYYNTQISTYKLTYISTVIAEELNSVASLYYNPQVASYITKYKVSTTL